MPPLTTSIDAVVFMTMGLILVLAAAPLGNAIGQQIDLNSFRWGPPTAEDRRREIKHHTWGCRLVGIAVIAFGLWRLLAQ